MKLETRIKIASSGYFVCTAALLFSGSHCEQSVASKALLAALISFALGFLTLRFPFPTTLLGSLVFGLTEVGFFVDGVRSGKVFQYPLGFGLASLIIDYITVVMFQALFAQIRLLFKQKKGLVSLLT